MWFHKQLFIPRVSHAAGIGGGIYSRPEVRLRAAAACCNVEVFAFGKRCRLFDADHIVFKAEVSIDVTLALEMPGDDLAAVGKGEHSALNAKDMRKVTEETGAKSLEVFEVRLAHFSEQQALEARPALAIIGAHLREQPVAFAAAACAAITNGDLPVGEVAPARGRAGFKLARLKRDPRAKEVDGLVLGAARFECRPGERFWNHGSLSPATVSRAACASLSFP